MSVAAEHARPARGRPYPLAARERGRPRPLPAWPGRRPPARVPFGSCPARGFSFVELLVAAGLLTVIVGIVTQWFFSQRQYQDRITRLSDIQENLRQATFAMARELKTGRQVIWPRVNPDQSPRTDSVLVFKNFRGAIVAFFHRPAERKIRRVVIPNGPGMPVEDTAPLGDGIASLTFTTMGPDNKLVSLHLSTEGVHHLDAVRLVNE